MSDSESSTPNIRSMDGDKPSQKLARKVFPILVRQARVSQPLSYKDVADEVGSDAIAMRYPLGIIGRCLEDLSKEWGERIPPIQALVVKRSLGVPGPGFGSFVPEDYESADQERKNEIARREWSRLARYDRWEEVLEYFSLPLPERRLPTLPTGSKMAQEGYTRKGPSEESEDHRKLKTYIAQTPEAVGLDAAYGTGEMEHTFRSLDAVDVLFRGPRWVGVEVKSSRSDEMDVMRGMFQCVKYRALLDASAKVDSRAPVETTVILALEDKLPTSLIPYRNLLSCVKKAV